ncbi:ATP-binding cassette subfamily F protein 3 [Maritalea mobilis]|uniref:ATP-binding cassette subfamily F protein 3 n=1 Tax=Maritalea mobilis TaxID=483324 RepID=A0A4V3DAS6_9HYPH|nr:ABC-F family ATP-binding cassette domain-containing protein [Maritalea mobilis]TDQ63634.1 ATP-binding cassette subfamily F protein 3 [Maritalea mobilis]
MLKITNLNYSIEGRSLFENASLTLPAGSKAGFVGRNGSGKTTLFRLLKGEIPTDSGDIEIHHRAKMGSVAQEAPATQDSVMDIVLEADKERLQLLEEAETVTDPMRIGEVHTRLAEIEAHSAEARASSILKGLGFDQTKQAEPCANLSGGWRMRVSLAGVLFSKPDLLLLDEPTNYLDLEGTLWLERYLANYPYTVFMISHDRDLLNKAVNSIVHLERGGLSFYRGAYDQFEENRRLQMDINNKQREKQLEQIAHMQKFVDRFRAKATKAKQAQSRLKRIEKIKPVEALFDEHVAPFTFPQPKRAVSAPIIDMEMAATGYEEGTPILSRISGRIDPEDRIALVGINGNGKSTFAKLLAGELKLMDGRLTKARKLEVAHFAQHQMDMLKPKQTPLEHVEPLMPYDSEAKRRARVAQMGLTTSRMDTLAENLSGGEKARLLMGLVTFNGPNLLILDEPTNHLDIDSRDALVQALNEYEGAVLIISHDRHLIEATVDQLWIAKDGTISVCDYDLETYQRSLTGTRDKPEPNKANSPADKKKDRKVAAEKRAQLAPLRKEIKQLESKVEKLNQQLAKTDEALEDPDLFQKDQEKAVQLGKDRADLAKDIEAAEELWLEKLATLEEAQEELGL